VPIENVSETAIALNGDSLATPNGNCVFLENFPDTLRHFEGDSLRARIRRVGLGEYGRTLTVLWADSLPNQEKAEKRQQQKEDDENMLPSQWWQK
jgi:hypothetical protein